MPYWKVICRSVTTALLSLICGCSTFDNSRWVIALEEHGESAWTAQWFLEGDKATVTGSDNGIIFSSGPDPLDQASHAVLWSKSSFDGDIRIEYDYTRLDSMMAETSVNILYMQATGLGGTDNPADIRESSEQRRVPWMKSYFLDMNLVHVSYAATGPNRADYISARQYPAETVEVFDDATLIPPVYENVGLFAPGETYHITATKLATELEFVVQHNGKKQVFSWSIAELQSLHSGRIGFRHMWARSSKYENIRVFVKEDQK